MKVIEKFLISKYGDMDRCEDGIYMDDNFIAVVDGATAKGEICWGGKTSGAYAKDTILKAMKDLDRAWDAETAVCYINQKVREAYGDNLSLAAEKSEERLVANIVIYSSHVREIWSFGDCNFIVDEEVYNNEKEIDRILAGVRSLIIHLELLEGKALSDFEEKDPGREFILPLLRKQQRLQNSRNAYSYDCIDGFEINPRNIKKIRVNENSTVVLASDGYPKLRPTLKESEEMLRLILEKDPLCIDLCKSTKGLKKGNISFDDRAYIRFKV